MEEIDPITGKPIVTKKITIYEDLTNIEYILQVLKCQ